MFSELRYGANALIEIEKSIKQMMRKWYLSSPVLSFVIWYLFLRLPKYYWPQSWFMFGALLSATVLLWGADFNAAPQAQEGR
ncbi:MAG: hypothetical protein KGS72_15250 [Cyanobacteria bacterium REEB67]|nr:hypothetical protein [Cyanobacteria bacterium REEB67]